MRRRTPRWRHPSRRSTSRDWPSTDGCDDGTLRGRTPAARADGDIGQAVLDAYVGDPRVHPFVPTVEVRDGAVILTGVAPNPEVARAADDDARNVVGAVAVHDDLKVAPALAPTNDQSHPRAGQERLRDQSDSRAGGDRRERPERTGLPPWQGRTARKTACTRSPLATSAPGARDVSDGLVLVAPRLGVTSAQPQ